MTPGLRAFYERHMEDEGHSDSSDHLSHDGDTPHYGSGFEDSTHPILEDAGFAHLVDSHFGPEAEGGLPANEWDGLEQEARTPLFEGSSSSR